MKIYLKPQLEISNVIANDIASSAGLDNWLNDSGSAYKEVDIVTYTFDGTSE